MRAFERGFSAIGTIHTSFRIHFFIILLIFLIFDLEVVLLVGILASINCTRFLLVILLVVFGVYLE